MTPEEARRLETAERIAESFCDDLQRKIMPAGSTDDDFIERLELLVARGRSRLALDRASKRTGPGL